MIMDLFGDGDKYRKIGEAMMGSFKAPKSNCTDDSCASPQKAVNDLGMFNFGGITSEEDSNSLKALGDRMLGKSKQG